MRYHQILSDPQYQSLIQRLETRDSSEFACANGSISDDYISYMREVGWGEIGQAGYMIYSGPCKVSDLFTGAPHHLSSYILFGDDFAGYAGGFNRDDGSVVEISLSDWGVIPCNESFFEFIVEKFDSQLSS